MIPTAEPAQVNHRATYREVLAEPRFRLLFSTRTVAITADALRITTFSVLVFSVTGSALLSALAFGIGFIPQLFGSLLLGSLADRLPPRALIAERLRLDMRRRPAARPGADADRGKPWCRGAGRPRHTGVQRRIESAGRAVAGGRRLCAGPFTEQHRRLRRAIVRSGAGRCGRRGTRPAPGARGKRRPLPRLRARYPHPATPAAAGRDRRHTRQGPGRWRGRPCKPPRCRPAAARTHGATTDAGPVATARVRSGRGRPDRRLRGRTPLRARLVRGADGLSAGRHAGR